MKNDAKIFLKIIEKLIDALGMKSGADNVVNVVREKDYYSLVDENDITSIARGMMPHVGLIREIPYPCLPTIAVMIKGQPSHVDNDFFYNPIELYYLLNEDVMQMLDDAYIRLEPNGLCYVRPRIGPPMLEAEKDSINKIADVVLRDLWMLVKNR